MQDSASPCRALALRDEPGGCCGWIGIDFYPIRLPAPKFATEPRRRPTRIGPTKNPHERHEISTSGSAKGHILKSSCAEHLWFSFGRSVKARPVRWKARLRKWIQGNSPGFVPLTNCLNSCGSASPRPAGVCQEVNGQNEPGARRF